MLNSMMVVHDIVWLRIVLICHCLSRSKRKPLGAAFQLLRCFARCSWGFRTSSQLCICWIYPPNQDERETTRIITCLGGNLYKLLKFATGTYGGGSKVSRVYSHPKPINSEMFCKWRMFKRKTLWSSMFTLPSLRQKSRRSIFSPNQKPGLSRSIIASEGSESVHSLKLTDIVPENRPSQKEMNHFSNHWFSGANCLFVSGSTVCDLPFATA